MRRKVFLLTSRVWNEWIAEDKELLEIADVRLITQKSAFSTEIISAERPVYVFVPHWSHIIPEELIRQTNVIIFHMTDLPYGRGGSPLQNLIIRGHSKTKISAIRCVSEIDAGPIYLKRELNLDGSAYEIFRRASVIIKDMIIEILRKDLEPVPQLGEIVQFKRRKPAESDLSCLNANELSTVYDFIRMLDAPDYPRSFLKLGNLRIEFSAARHGTNIVQGNFEIKKEESHD